jgi:hypothetical protein
MIITRHPAGSNTCAECGHERRKNKPRFLNSIEFAEDWVKLCDRCTAELTRQLRMRRPGSQVKLRRERG